MSNRKRVNGATAPRVLLALTVTEPARPGEDAVLALHSEMTPEATVTILRRIADRYEAAGPRALACPACGAAPGEACVDTATGFRRPMRETHPERGQMPPAAAGEDPTT